MRHTAATCYAKTVSSIRSMGGQSLMTCPMSGLFEESEMSNERAALAAEILDNAEVMQFFDDCVWVRIEKEDYDEYGRLQSRDALIAQEV